MCSLIAQWQGWKTLQQAEVAIPSMNGICTSVAESWQQWQDWRADASAHRAPLPSGWEEKLNRFQKMIVVRALAEVSYACQALSFRIYHICVGEIQFFPFSVCCISREDGLRSKLPCPATIQSFPLPFCV